MLSMRDARRYDQDDYRSCSEAGTIMHILITNENLIHGRYAHSQIQWLSPV